MDKVGVLTDTTASIPSDLVKKLEIELVAYHILAGNNDFRDLVEVDPEGFAEYLEGVDALPTTSCPSPGEYLEGLLRLAERTKEIVVLTMTSKGSGALQSCLSAVDILREQMPQVQVRVIDTLQVAMSEGWAAIEAARAALEGLNQNEVVERAKLVARKGLLIQTADTLRYLYLGGRIGRAQHLVGSLLNVKPIIGMEDGVIVAWGTARTRSKAYAKMVELACQRIGEGARVRIAFTHVAAEAQLVELQELFLRHFECIELLRNGLSPALAVQSGPGTVGVSLLPE